MNAEHSVKAPHAYLARAARTDERSVGIRMLLRF